MIAKILPESQRAWGTNLVLPEDSMSKSSRLILGFAALGLAVAALILSWLKFIGEFDATLYTAFAIACPPALLCIPFSEVMKDRVGFYSIWLLIGLANSGIYAVIGAAVAGQLWKSDDKVEREVTRIKH